MSDQQPSPQPEAARLPVHTDYQLVYLRVSGCYFWFNILQLATTLVLMYCLHVGWFAAVTIIEVFIAFMVALDLILRYFTDGSILFFTNWDNRINIFILIVLIVSISSDLVAPQLTHHDSSALAGVLLVVRYGIQVLRLCRLLLQTKRALDHTKHQIITLNQPMQQDNNDAIH